MTQTCQHKFYYPGGLARCWHCDVEFKRSELFTVPCEWCGAKPGNPCRTPSGYKTEHPHTLREKAFVDRLKGDET